MNNCQCPPREHSHIINFYLYCERCHVVCSHHMSRINEDEERYTKNMRKRGLFCRAGHDVADKDIKIDKNNKPHCGIHPNKSVRWKVVNKNVNPKRFDRFADIQNYRKLF